MLPTCTTLHCQGARAPALLQNGLVSNENDIKSHLSSRSAPGSPELSISLCPRDENGAAGAPKTVGGEGKASNQPSRPPGRSPVNY